MEGVGGDSIEKKNNDNQKKKGGKNYFFEIKLNALIHPTPLLHSFIPFISHIPKKLKKKN